MRWTSKTWAVLCLLLLLAAGYFWNLGNQRARPTAPAETTSEVSRFKPLPELGAENFLHNTPLLTTLAHLKAAPPTNATAASAKSLLAYRLSNTPKSLPELMRGEQSILLRSALIDTAVGADLNIPAPLRADGDPGSYLVQARGAIDEAFRNQLAAAGARIVSYIPNNAYLVRVQAAGAEQLKSVAQSVLPWEPYYKLELPLLALAVDGQPLPDDSRLNVLVFSDGAEAGRKSLLGLGAEILGEDRSPFGHQFTVQLPLDSLTALARIPEVQSIEYHRARQLANDLSRVRVGVSTNASLGTNYLGLSGLGVRVNVNDTGIDQNHPALQGRVSGEALTDIDGHGTHVAATLAGNGGGSFATNAPGSPTNSNYRGMAPEAQIVSLGVDLVTGPLISDSHLQETAARTNAFISNNSWGYINIFDYNLSAASFDAAIRDSLPEVTGSQPVLFVFAAGNDGGGTASGEGGVPGTIGAPATAKNVITVGAIENFRSITNEIVIDGETNRAFFAQTDSNDEVASFSSRGNVGIGLEGPSGRFKPDLVAPGTFIVSARADGWGNPTASTNVSVNRIPDQLLKAGKTNSNSLFVPANGVRLGIRTIPNRRSPSPFPALPIYLKKGAPPAIPGDLAGTGQVFVPADAGVWNYAIVNPTTRDVQYDLQTFLFTTNISAEYYAGLKVLNDELAPNYRFESGTSMAAPVVSGVLALMQEMLQSPAGLNTKAFSPALLKAMLINGARSVGTKYNLQVENPINYQGWGVVNLTNSIPRAMRGGLGTKDTWPVILFDQTNYLATGESHSRTIGLQRNAQIHPLRVTLVWTDPPGNPAASLKLVNDLDLIVSDNITTNLVYYGNNIPQGSDFNDPRDPSDTNAPPAFDLVNNVENVFINRPLSTNYTITVRAHRVNVNAVTARTNGIFQDYALVISIGNSSLTNTFSSISGITGVQDPSAYVSTLTNGVVRRDERVGANNPQLPLPNHGSTNQWNFYTYRNTNNFTNVLFRTFLPPNLSLSRYRESDIDLYVSTDPGLLILDPAVLNDPTKTLRSRTRGGSERIILTDSALDRVYYIGVKSEDQQSSVYHLFALSSELPFSSTDEQGNALLRFIPVPQDIPDGSPDTPGGATFFAFVDADILVDRVVLTNTVAHENGGDLFGNLSHLDTFTVLNNHRSFVGAQTFIYDDSEEDPVPTSQPTDGPGNLRDFQGQEAAGDWEVRMIDNSPEHIGRVESLFGLIEKLTELTNGNSSSILTLAAGRCRTVAFTVPLAVTNVTLSVFDIIPPLPVDLYVQRGSPPDAINYEKYARILPPGGSLSVGLADRPPLQPGLYYVRVCNPNPVAITFKLRVDFDYGLSPAELTSYVSTNTPNVLIDDAIFLSIITVTNNRAITDVRVGVRIDHPRLSDLVLHLVSPQGSRLLLAENRGSTTATNFGYGNAVSNITYATFTENTNLGSVYKFALPPFGVISNTVLLFTNSFENAAATNYVQNDIFEDWFVLTNGVAVLTETNLARTGSNVLALSNGRISHALPTTPDEDYLLTFAYRKVSSAPTQSLALAVSSKADIYEHLDPPTVAVGGTNAVAVPKLRLCPGQEVIITVATNCLVVDGPDCVGPEGDTTRLYRGLPWFSLIGCWSHSPKVLDSNTVASLPFYIGTNTMFAAPTEPGDYYLFLGENEDNLVDNTGDYAVTVQWQQCQYASAEFLVGATTNTLVGDFFWKTNVLLFAANSTTTNLILQPGINTTMLFDSVELQHPVSTVYYLPEEPLTPLQNEVALGEWKLEIWDNRAGPVQNPGTLLSWALSFRFANTTQCIPLTNGVAHNDVVRGDEIVCFVVEVPREITQADNFLFDFFGGGIELLYSPFGVPTGNSPPDPVLPQPANIPFVVTPAFPAGAELPLGQRYFLGVRNIDPSQTNAFRIRVDFDVPIIRLANGVWFTNTIPVNPYRFAATTNSIIAVTNMHYYRFDVPTAESTSATFKLAATNGDVNLVLRRALPVVDLFPRPTFFDYESTACFPDPEIIIVNSNSLPVRLAPGRWYLGVYNVDTNDVTYGIQARHSTNGPLYQTFELTNGVPTNFTVQANSFLTNFFRFISDQTNAAVLFEIYDLDVDGDADLIVKRSDLPAPDLYDFSYLSITNGYEPVPLRTSIFIPHLNATNWFLNVVNRGTNPVSGMICATVSTNSSLVSCNFKASGFTDAAGFTIQWSGVPGNNYEVQVSTDLVTWTTIATFPNVMGGPFFTYTDPTPLVGQQLRVYRVRQY